MKNNRAGHIDPAAVKNELKRARRKKKHLQIFADIAGTLTAVSAAAVIISTLFFPVFRIEGASMSPTVSDGAILIAQRGKAYETGDIIGFNYGGKVLIKRLIGKGGDQVDIGRDGTVYVNGRELKEPYIYDKAFGECDIELPFQVPDGECFVMGDHRSGSVDSRNAALGCVAQGQIVGRIVFCVWPVPEFGMI